MKKFVTALAVSLLAAVSTPAFATEAPKPESIAEKMAFKLVRGVTNFATAIAEIPKQTIITAENHGNIGYVVGPLKGVGMTFYRAIIGITETVFFMVPQPGYYDPMMDPEFVWHGWDGGKQPVVAETSAQGSNQAGSPTTQPADAPTQSGDK